MNLDLCILWALFLFPLSCSLLNAKKRKKTINVCFRYFIVAFFVWLQIHDHMWHICFSTIVSSSLVFQNYRHQIVLSSQCCSMETLLEVDMAWAAFRLFSCKFICCCRYICLQYQIRTTTNTWNNSKQQQYHIHITQTQTYEKEKEKNPINIPYTHTITHKVKTKGCMAQWNKYVEKTISRCDALNPEDKSYCYIIFFRGFAFYFQRVQHNIIILYSALTHVRTPNDCTTRNKISQILW